MQQKALKIFKASAGSGKTWQLTLNYLILLFQSPKEYRNILAVTFTNKAAGEMKTRILEKLFQLSNGDNEADDYAEVLLSGNYASNMKSVRTTANFLLKSILNDYSGFYVQTIDKFFQWVIRGFTREIGLQNAYNLELNSNNILSEAVDRLMLKMEDDLVLRKWLIQFAEENIEEGKNWNFHSDVFLLGQEIFKEHYKSIRQKDEENATGKEEFDGLRKKLQKKIFLFDKFLKTEAEKGIEKIEKSGLSLDNFKYKNTGPAAFFYRILKEDLSVYIPGVRILSAVDNPDAWVKTGSEKESFIKDLVNSDLNPMMKVMLDYREKNIEDYCTAKAIWDNIYSFGILNDIYSAVREIANEKNVFLLSDSSIFLKKIIGENDAPFIYEKAGNYFNSYMLDEFQDTSRFQWDNFRPLIQNSMSENKANLIVGDVKQAIYRWRNSDWKILASEVSKGLHEEMIGYENLNRNFRSSGNIVRFNNTVFNYAPSIIKNLISNELVNNEMNDFTSEWLELTDKVYGESGQLIPESKRINDGYITHSFTTGLRKDEKTNYLTEKIPALICDLQDRDYKASDITILVRKASEGREIAKILMKAGIDADNKYNFGVISNDSLFLNNNTGVKLLIALLTYFNHHENKLNEAYIRFEYFWYLKEYEGEKPVANNVFSADRNSMDAIDTSGHFKLLMEQTDSLRRLPLYELTERLIDIFQLNKKEGNLAYIQAFQNFVLEFIRKESSDISSFLNFWENSGSSATLSVSESQDAIQIMTIHKAKGLEFKVVILPYCEWSLSPDTRGVKKLSLWPSTLNTDYTEFSHLPLNFKSGLKKTVFRREYYEELFKTYVDNLNLLYVAFTRSVNELHCFSNLSKKPESLSNIGDLIYKMSANNEPVNCSYPTLDYGKYYDTEKMYFSYGEAEKFIEKIAKNAEVNTFFLSSYPVSGKTESLRLNHKNIYLSDLKESRYTKTGYGTQMHEVFSDLKKKEDLDFALRKAWLKGLMNSKEKENLKTIIGEKLDSEPFNHWFSDEWECKTESDIMNREGKILRPDRVMFQNDKVVVLDYKFGSVKDKGYHSQMIEYRKALEDAGYSSIVLYLWYFNLNELEEVE